MFTVNAGSDTITSFAIQDDFSLVLVDTIASGGVGPNSLAYDDGRVYVTNIDRDGLALGVPGSTRGEPNDEGNVVGFSVDNGVFTQIPGAVANLDNRPANIDFSIDGNRLIVSSITSGSAVLPGPNAEASIYSFDVSSSGALTLADTGTSTERFEGSTPDRVTVTVVNEQGATAPLGADGFFPGDVDPSTGRFSTESGFFFTEPWVGFHNGQFDLFNVGQPASRALEQIAETGAAGLIFDAFDAAIGAGTVPAGFQAFAQNEQQLQFISPGQTASTSFDIRNGANYQYFSFASMVIPTNDAFFGNDDPKAYEVFGNDGSFNGPVTIEVTAADIYDSGTELNDGRGAAGFSLGIGGAPGASNSGTSTDTFGTGEHVAAHPGLDGFLDFNTAARTTIADLLDPNELIATITIDVEEGQIGRNLPSAIDFDIASIGGSEYVVVTEAREFNAEGAPPALPALQAGSVSVYELGADSSLTLTEDDFSFGDPTQQNVFGADGQQLTACWIDFGADGSTFFVSNAINATISSLTLNPDGSVTVLDTVAAAGNRQPFTTPGQVLDGPTTFGNSDGFIDLDVSPDGEFLYQLAGLSGEIYVYSVSHNGQLTETQVIGDGLPLIDTQGIISVGERTSTTPTQDAPADGVYTLENAGTSRVLDADGRSEGYNVETSTSPSDDDEWELIANGEGYHYLRNLVFNRFLDADPDNGVETSRSPSSDDLWELVPNGDGYFYIRNVHFDSFLTQGPGIDVNLADPTSAASLWRFDEVVMEPANDLVGQSIALQNVGTDRWLDADGHNVDTSVRQSADDVWEVHDAGDGAIFLRNEVTGRWLDADGSSRGYNVDTSTNPASDDRWLLVPVEGGYALVSVDFGRYAYAGERSERYNVVTSDVASDNTTWVVSVIGS